MLTSEQRCYIIRLLTHGTDVDDEAALNEMKNLIVPKRPLPPLNYAETELRKAGRNIPAIKAYRERIQKEHGFTPGLKESKDLVETVPVYVPSEK